MHINIIKKIIRPCATLAVACMLAASAAHAQHNVAKPTAIVRAKIDSTSVTMADRIMLRVEVLKDTEKGAIANLPSFETGKKNDFHGAEVRDITVDSTEMPNNRLQINYNILLQPFNPGTLTFPAFKYVIDADTFYSEITTLKVNEPDMPKVMRDSLIINPMMGTVSIKARWYDYVPSWWYWLVIGLALVALGVVVALLYKRNGPSLLPRKKIIPPHIIALKRLSQLRQQKLAESGNDKLYYTELTDILRQYLEGRFGIFAREMTSSQILEAVEMNPVTAQWREQFARMLETSDFVKFAKLRANPQENVAAFGTVQNFVEQTKPVEEPENTKGSSKGKSRKKKKKKKNK